MVTVPALAIICAALLAFAVGVIVGWLVRGRRPVTFRSSSDWQ